LQEEKWKAEIDKSDLSGKNKCVIKSAGDGPYFNVEKNDDGLVFNLHNLHKKFDLEDLQQMTGFLTKSGSSFSSGGLIYHTSPAKIIIHTNIEIAALCTSLTSDSDPLSKIINQKPNHVHTEQDIDNLKRALGSPEQQQELRNIIEIYKNSETGFLFKDHAKIRDESNSEKPMELNEGMIEALDKALGIVEQWDEKNKAGGPDVEGVPGSGAKGGPAAGGTKGPAVGDDDTSPSPAGGGGHRPGIS